jgi:hypothetical protein
MECNLMTQPVVHVVNASAHALFIDHDPNWDDQILVVDGQPVDSIFHLPAGACAVLTVAADTSAAKDANLIGVIFSDGKHYDYGSAGSYQATIGHGADGLLGVTDQAIHRQPRIGYVLEAQTDWSMTLRFADR